MPPRPRVRDLEAQLQRLQEDLDAAVRGREAAEEQLAEATTTIAEQTTVLTAATAQAAAGNQGHGNQPAGAAVQAVIPTVPRPVVPRGTRIKIQEEMGLDDHDYHVIQQDLHKICHASGLDWTIDFRRQKSENVALLYRAARNKHPILQKYENDWATAELVKQYFQNARGHARHKGYLPPAPPRAGSSNANRENRPGNRRGARSVRGVGAAA
ncbi:hypothetical protein C8T65DRAFT_745275 [Cerioporus squamosus]|nr:hypothetical protein C8T65DRAFT_745275 [Cerioporus squamosus]